MKNLVLIGLPGSGKTTLGKLLGQRLNKEFIDLDSEIEKSRGQSIESIFRLSGEETFRNLESQAALKAAAKEGPVISTGGGIVLREENMQALGRNAIVIFLDRDPQYIAGEIDIKNRPLLKAGPEKVYELYKKRLPLYEKYGDFKVKSNAPLNGVLEELLKIAALEETENKSFAVIGSPIGHSLSPDIHLPVLRKYYKEPEYSREEIPLKGLSDWLKRVKDENIAGFNVTMPHKIGIIPYLDILDGEAALLNSVNTVINREGILWGYNTDGEGFALALKKQGYTLRGSRITIIGTGAVAATIAAKALKEEAAEVNILGRNFKKAQETAEKALLLRNNIPVRAALWEGDALKEYCGKTDILINATPLGMKGVEDNFTDLRFISSLPETALICDLIYSPAQTKLLLEGQRQGIKTLGGLEMLIYQALLADRLFLPGEMLLNRAYKRVGESLKERGIRV